MSIKAVIATGNKHKIEEIASALESFDIELVSVFDLDADYSGPEETEDTFEGNAMLKARAVSERFNVVALADDSGLEVDALGGAPGVYSARYAGVDGDDTANNIKLLAALEGVSDSDRTARFVSTIVLYGLNLVSSDAEPILIVRGEVEGTIGHAPHGANGFGYDPLFWPADTPGKSMAQLTMAEKNAISHRGRALVHLTEKLKTYL